MMSCTSMGLFTCDFDLLKGHTYGDYKKFRVKEFTLRVIIEDPVKREAVVLVDKSQHAHLANQEESLAEKMAP